MKLRRAFSPINTWVTGKPAADWRFLVYSDTRSSGGVHAQIIAQMAKENARLTVHCGDLSGPASAAVWRQFLAESAPLRRKMPFYPVIGNHDRGDYYYPRLFRLPGAHKRYYVVDYGGYHLIILDSNQLWGFRGRQQLRWLNAVLSKRTGNRSLVFMHHPPTSATSVLTKSIVERRLWPILQAHKIRCVFAGHFHHYERFNWQGIEVVITGGGGSKLRDGYLRRSFATAYRRVHHYCRLSVSGDRLTLQVVQLGGTLIETISL